MTGTPFQAAPLNIPGWGMDHAAYERACRYLGLSPKPALHEKVARYLLLVAASQPAPTGFKRWLAELRPGRTSLGFLDLWTRLLMPSHPWRFRLNAVVAAHECDPDGFREMSSHSGSRVGAWLSFARIGATASMNLILGGAWLSGQAILYAARGRGLRREQSYFHGKSVLVTGAGRGLGLSLSTRLLSLGANVVAVLRAGPALDALHCQIVDANLEKRFRVATADVAVAGALSEGLAEIGVDASEIDVAIINAGIKVVSPLPGTNDMLKRVFDVNVFGAMDNVAALLPAFLARGRGNVIFISSQGRWHGMPASGSYNASKAALSLLAESLAMDLGEDGRKAIHITSVEPGLIRTGMIMAGTLQDYLAVDAEEAACRILRCAATNRRTCRFPLLFTLMTAALAVLPQGLRIRALGRLRN